MATNEEPSDVEIRTAAVHAAAAGLQLAGPDAEGNPELAAERAITAVVRAANNIEHFIKTGM